MVLFISVLVLFVIIGMFVGSAALFWVTKLFKVENPSYKKSLIIFAIASIVGVIVNMIFGFVMPVAAYAMSAITTFLTLSYLLKRYYLVTWAKSLGIYVLSLTATLLTYLILIFITYLFVGQIVMVAGISMNPTYSNGDYVLINMLSKKIYRGDVVIFYPPNKTDYQIGRIISLPSDEIVILDGQVMINNSPLTEDYSIGVTSGDLSITLGENQYFIMGDNRDNSFDSRNFGPIVKSDIIGKVFDKIYTTGK